MAPVDESFTVSSVRVSDMRSNLLYSNDLSERGIYFEYGDTNYGEMEFERIGGYDREIRNLTCFC